MKSREELKNARDEDTDMPKVALADASKKRRTIRRSMTSLPSAWRSMRFMNAPS